MAYDDNPSRSTPASNEPSYNGEGPGRAGVDCSNPAPARDEIGSDRSIHTETHSGDDDGSTRPS